MRAGERADERRLAGAVAADQADDLARVEVDADVVDGVDAAERDADVAHLDQRHALGCVRGRHGASAVMCRLPSTVIRVEADGDDEHDAGDHVLGRAS